MVVLDQPAAGYPEIGAGTARPGIPDTSWIQAAPSAFALQITDTLGKAQSAVTGLVGDLVPVRIKITSHGNGLTGTAAVSLTSDPSLQYFSDPNGTTPITAIAITNDSVSPIIWVRAIDATASATFGAAATIGSDGVSSSVTNNVFAFPRLRQASFHDANCDGLVDSLVLRFLDPVRFRSAAATSLADSIDLLFPGEVLTPSVLGATPRTSKISDTVISLAWNPASMAVASILANRIVLANPLGGSRLVLVPAILLDKAPPIAKSGSVQQKWVGAAYVSTIQVQFSEEIDTLFHPAGALLPFNVKRGGVIVRLDSIPTAAAVTVLGAGSYAWNVQGRVNLIQPGDSLIVSGSMIHDLAGNTTGDLCANKPFPTMIVTGAVPYDVLVLDQNGDGNGDHLRVAYHDSIGDLARTIHRSLGIAGRNAHGDFRPACRAGREVLRFCIHGRLHGLVGSEHRGRWGCRTRASNHWPGRYGSLLFRCSDGASSRRHRTRTHPCTAFLRQAGSRRSDGRHASPYILRGHCRMPGWGFALDLHRSEESFNGWTQVPSGLDHHQCRRGSHADCCSFHRNECNCRW